MYKQFQTDKQAEQEGIVIDYGDFRVTVARAGGSNRKYKKLLNTMAKPYQRLLDTDAMDDVKADKIVMEVFAKTVVKKWETLVDGKWKSGIENPDGKALLPVNVENLVKTFTALPDLFDDLRDQASKSGLFRAALKEAAAKN